MMVSFIFQLIVFFFGLLTPDHIHLVAPLVCD